jgi:hypothetical protein
MSILLKLIQKSRNITSFSSIGFKTVTPHLNLNQIEKFDENEISIDKPESRHQKKEPLKPISPPTDFYYAKQITEYAKSGQVKLVLINKNKNLKNISKCLR